MTFSFSEAQDAEYAAGWPHVRRLTDGPGPEDPVRAARAILSDVDPVWSPTRSRAMCLAYLRGFEVTPQGSRPNAAAAMARRHPLDDAEVDHLLRRWFSRSRYWFQIEELVLSLEALLGSDAAGVTIAAHLARARPGDAGQLDALFGSAMTTPAPAMTFCLGFVALRSPATRAALTGLRVSGLQRVVLDLVLEGADACRRHDVRHLFAASFAGDDPGYLAELSATERYYSSLTPRFPYLGGEAVLAHYVARARQGIPPHLAIRFVEEFGTIRHPLTIELMAALARSPVAGDRALSWIYEHAEFVEAHRAALPDALRAALDSQP